MLHFVQQDKGEGEGVGTRLGHSLAGAAVQPAAQISLCQP